MQNFRPEMDPASRAPPLPPRPTPGATVAAKDEPSKVQQVLADASLKQDVKDDNVPRTINAQDGVDLLAAQIGSLGLEPATSPDDDGPVPLRIVRASGEPEDALQFCPGARIVTHSLTWHYITAMPESAGATLACTACYRDHIQKTALAARWTSIVVEDGTAVLCCFRTLRVKQVLWPQAVASNDMSALNAFLKRSADLEACPEDKAITGVKGTTWYGLREREIEGFEVCEACLEKYIAGTAFDARFAKYQEPAEEHTWTCHMRGDMVGRIATQMAESNDWQGFLEAACERLQLPACTGEPVQSDACGWYLARGDLRNAPVCATCFRDSLATTLFSSRFHRYRPQIDKVPSPGVWQCSLSSLPSMVALEAALEQRDFRILEETLKNIVAAPTCAKEGIVGGSWWTLAGGGCPAFAVCYACFAGVFWMHGLDGFLERAAAPAGEAMMCSLHPSHPRFAQYWSKMCEAVDKGVFSYLGDYVRRVSGVRLCAHNGGFANAKWWGYADSYFCEDCYVTYVKDTAMGAHLQLNGQVVGEVTVCQIWSPRMRHYWEEVCASGAPGSSTSNKALEDFLGVSRYRRQTYLETLYEIETLKRMKEIQRNRALFDAKMSIQYQGIDGMAKALGSTGPYEYGSNSIGWYDTSAGLEARMLFGRFQTGLLDSQFKPSEVRWMLELQERWNEVE